MRFDGTRFNFFDSGIERGAGWLYMLLHPDINNHFFYLNPNQTLLTNFFQTLQLDTTFDILKLNQNLQLSITNELFVQPNLHFYYYSVYLPIHSQNTYQKIIKISVIEYDKYIPKKWVSMQ